MCVYMCMIMHVNLYLCVCVHICVYASTLLSFSFCVHMCVQYDKEVQGTHYK